VTTLTPDLRLPHHPSVDRRRFLLTSLVGAFAAPLAAEAQQPEKLYRIGMLERTSPAVNAANLEGFRRGLRELGYVEGKSLSSSTGRPRAATSGSWGWRRS
jgi:hypothetical protein